MRTTFGPSRNHGSVWSVLRSIGLFSLWAFAHPALAQLDTDTDGLPDAVETVSSGFSLTLNPFQIPDDGGSATQTVDLSAQGATIGQTVTLSNLVADGDLNGNNEFFTLNVNSGEFVSGNLTTDVQCNGALIPTTTTLNTDVTVIDIGGGTPGIRILGTTGSSVDDLGDCNNVGLQYQLTLTGSGMGPISRDDFETDRGWTINPNGTDTATTGQWEVANPQSTEDNGLFMQLGDTTSGTQALVTQAASGSSLGSFDIDNGVTSALSPAYRLPNSAQTLELNYYFGHLGNANSDDFLRITLIGSSSQQVLLSETGSGADRGATWTPLSADVSAFAGQSVQLLVEAADGGSPSLVEAGIDDIAIAIDLADFDGDGIDNRFDLDSDNDTIPDLVEAGLADVDGDYLADNPADEGSVTSPQDSDSDGIPDFLDWESNNPANDGTAFDISATAFAVLDSNGDGQVGAGDIGGGVDADSDGIDDLVDGDPNNPGSGTPNTPPVANPDNVSTPVDTPAAITLTGSDADGDSLIFVIDRDPFNGTLSGIAPNVTYTPNPGFFGTDSFTFIVNDGTEDSPPAMVEVTVTQVNAAPTANPQSVATNEDTPVAIVLTGTDPDNDPLSFAITGGPGNGSLSGAAPNLTYTPNAGFFGTDSFTFIVNDGELDSAPATVSISVVEVNGAPTANPQTVATDEDTPVAIVLTGTDPDGDPLSFSVSTAPSHGGLSGTPPNLTYTPNAGFSGSDNFSFIVNDGSVDSAPATVTIDVAQVNSTPTANGQSVITDEDVPVAITLTGTDADGDPLTFAVDSNPGNGVLSGTAPNLTYTPNTGFAGADSFTFVVNDGISDSAPATVSITVNAVNAAPTANPQTLATGADTPLAITLTGSDPDGDPLTFAVTGNPANGALSGIAPNLTYTPNTGFAGTDDFTFIVNDGSVDSAPATVSIAVAQGNEAPTANPQSVTTDENTPLALTLTGSDPDGDPLSFAVTASPTNGVLSGAVPNLTYTPNAGFFGADSFTFIVNDGALNSLPATVDITVNEVNIAPAATPQSVSTNVDIAVAITLAGTDPDGDSLTFFVDSNPSQGVLTGTAPNLTYTPNPGFTGADSFTFVANDGSVDSAPATVDITVTPVGSQSFCGEPSYDRFVDRGTFLWSACDGSNHFFVRVTAGGSTQRIDYRANVETPGGVTNLAGFSVESNDVLDTNVADTFAYLLKVKNNAQDGAEFTVDPGSACMEFQTPTDLPVYLGASRTMLSGDTLDLINDGPCTEVEVPVTPLTDWVFHTGGVTTNANQISYSGTPTGWSNNSVNSQPLSSLGFDDDFEVRFTVDSDPANATWIVGLGVQETGTNWRDVDYGMRSNGGALSVWENGAWRTNSSSLSVGDVISIYINAGFVEYRLNGAMVHTSSFAGAPDFYVDTSFKEGAITLSVDIAGVASPVDPLTDIALMDWFGATGGVTVSLDSLSYSGTPAGWSNTVNSIPISVLGVASEYTLSWTVDSDPSASTWIVGLGVTDSGTNWRDVDYGLRCANGALTVHENGAFQANGGVLATGDVLSIHVSGTVLEYRRNGSTFHSTTITGSENFYVDTAFKSGAVDLGLFTVTALLPN